MAASTYRTSHWLASLRRQLLGALLGLLTGTVVLAQPGTPAEEPEVRAFGQAENAFQQALAGSSGGIEQSLSQFGALSGSERPVALLAQSYLGATQTLQGREAWMPWSKMRATEKGLATLEKALQRSTEAGEQRFREVPVQLEVKLVAAITFRQVPDAVFHRRDQSRQLLREVLDHRLFAASPASFRAWVWDEAATSARERNDRSGEVDALRQCLEAARQSSDPRSGKFLSHSQRRLKELGA